MIKLPKKIKAVIENELVEDYSVVEYVHIKRMYKEMCVHLVVLRVGSKNSLLILRYFGDRSYSFLGGYANIKEIVDELSFQVNKLA